MKIGIDIDGVILDFERVMRVYAEFYDLFILNKKGVVNSKEFNYLKRYDWTKEEREYFIDKFLIYATYKTPFIPGSKEGIKFLSELGFETSIITARGSLREETKYVVEKILCDNNVEVNSINWAITDKVNFCKNNGIDIMIEDNYDTCLALANAGIKCILLLSGEDRYDVSHPLITCCNNWGEICRELVPYSIINIEKDTALRIIN